MVLGGIGILLPLLGTPYVSRVIIRCYVVNTFPVRRVGRRVIKVSGIPFSFWAEGFNIRAGVGSFLPDGELTNTLYDHLLCR